MSGPIASTSGGNPVTSSPSVTVPATATERTRRRSGLNLAQQRELTKAAEILAAAREADHATRLNARAVTAEGLAALESAISAAEVAGAETGGTRSQRVQATAAEKTAGKRLLLCLQEIQQTAKRAFRTTGRERLLAYQIGKKLGQSRAALEGHAAAILAAAQADGLPGLPAASLAEAQNCLATYKLAQASQGSQVADSTQKTAERDALITDVRNRRIAIQLAADAEWAVGKAGTGPKRRQFQLPASRPFRG